MSTQSRSQPPRSFGNRYAILRPIARGGMAEVHLARDQLLNRRVAIKVLFPELSVDRSFVERFRREAQAAANITHPNIVSVYDWGEEGGTYYIVMEYVEGRSLADLVAKEAPLPAERAAAIGADVASALALAHRNGVVHRDVKPANVLLDADGHVKVTDFGIARAAQSSETLTRTGAVMGTATYFSPEQAQGYGVDARSDVYSLGVVLYEMVLGRPPFTGDTPLSIAYKHVREEPQPPRQANPAVPEPFEAVVLHAMAKDPDARYATADELRADLVRFSQGRGVIAGATAAATAAAMPAVPPTVAAPNPAVQATNASHSPTQVVPPREAAAGATRPAAGTGPGAGPAEGARRKRPVGVGVALALVLLLALVAVGWLLARSLGFFGSSAGSVRVPELVNSTAEAAVSRLDELGLKAREERENNDDVPANTVFAQDPAPGTDVGEGDTVVLKVSQGSSPVEVSDVVGKPLDEARTTLEGQGLVVAVREQSDDDAPEGEVLGQNPEAGSEARKGSTVRLTVSTGRGSVQVPNVVGAAEADAANQLGQEGFRVATRREPSDRVAEGNVIRTDPAAGARAQRGSTVTMFVSSGAAQVEVPNVVGRTAEDAQSQLTGAGFRVNRQERTDATSVGQVIEQSPAGGSSANKGATVTIVVGRMPGVSGGSGGGSGETTNSVTVPTLPTS